MRDMNKIQQEGKPNHGGNIISHSRKWQELEYKYGMLHLGRYIRRPLFSRLVKQNQFIFTQPTPTLLQPTSRRHSTQNRKKRSSSSSVRTGTSSHGSPLTCLEFPEDWLSTDYESTQSSSP